MNTMTDSETYNGYANRETWAFNLHWQNDQGLYNETLEEARAALESGRWDDQTEPNDDFLLGEVVVSYWRDRLDDMTSEIEAGVGRDHGYEGTRTLRMFEREVGSWWRIDYAEVGAAVRESLDAES